MINNNNNGKRPDSLTFTPWQGCKSLTWDVTADSTLADSNLRASTHSAGGAAEIASVRKNPNIPSFLQTTSSNQSQTRRLAHLALLDTISCARSADG